MKKIKKYDIPMNEVIDTGPSEIVEKFLDVSEIENEKNHSLVRIDINMIEYPLFTKSTSKKKNQIIRYFFNRSKEAYIQVNPTSGDYIPGELEERVFIALLKIMRDKRYNNMFYTTISEILTNMGIAQESFKGFYGRISKALLRLSQTSYTFKNSLYSNKIKGIIEEQINTNIMNIHMISLKQARESEKELFSDRRIKEVIKVSISEHFYDNIIRKGYLVYDSQLLLSMENPITRALYMLINKLRFNRMHIKVLSMNLIKRIPLSENIQKIGRTIKIIDKSCQELKKMNLIQDYAVIKNSKWVESEFEFYFNETHNELKQTYFFDDKNHFDNLLITHTDSGVDLKKDGNEQFEAVKAETVDRIPTNEKLEEIFKILPTKARELKTLPKVIKDGIRQYGFEHIKLVSEYVKAQKVSNIRSYIMQALSKGWAEDYIVQKKNSTSQKVKNETLDLREFEVQPLESVELFGNHLEVQQFLSTTSVEIKSKIEQDAYKDYIKMCGIEGKIQKMAFSAAKEKIIKDYLSKNLANYTAQTAINLEINNNSNPNQIQDIEVLEFVLPNKEKNENLKTAEEIVKVQDLKIESEIVTSQTLNNPKVV
ncbi:MAG: replication initiator protein A, partial [Cetobacterium sp.]